MLLYTSWEAASKRESGPMNDALQQMSRGEQGCWGGGGGGGGERLESPLHQC